MIYAALSEFPILALAALGFYISFRFLQFPDLTVDAAFMLGMSFVGIVVHHWGGSDIYALILAMLAGAFAGCITGFLHTSRYLGINKFLAGMLVSFGTYSICFRMSGSAELSLYQDRHIMLFGTIWNTHSRVFEVFTLTIFTLIVWFIVYRFLNTPFGLTIRSIGRRPEIAAVSGYNSKVFLILGLAFSNSLVALAGWLEAVTSRNVSLKNFGIIINVLAAVLLGDFIRHLTFALLPLKWKHQRNWLPFMLLSPLAGALLYSLIKSFVIKVLSGQFTVTITSDLQFIVSLSIILAVFAGRKLGAQDPIDDNS